MEPGGFQKRPKWSQKGAKVSQGTSQNTLCGTGPKKLGKGEHPGPSFGSHFVPKSIKNAIENSFKIDYEKTWKKMPTDSQNGAEFDAKTH